MAWSTPLTAVANATLTAAQWNASVRDNLLETAPAKATAAGRFFVTTGANAIAERVISSSGVVTAQTTSSTSYTDLATVGPAVTLTTGASALVFINAAVANDTTGNRSLASYAISGATSQAAADADAIIYDESGADRIIRAATVIKPTLTPGSNTFTMKYRVSGNTGTFQFRSITVIAL